MTAKLRRLLGLAGLALATSALVLVAILPAQAATLFADNFDDGNHNGWSSSGGSWQVAAGTLEQRSASTDARLRGGPASLADTAVTARVQPRSFNGSGRFVGIGTRAQGSSNYGIASTNEAECNHPIEVRGTVPEPRQFYSYTLDSAASLPTIIPAGAGVGKVG